MQKETISTCKSMGKTIRDLRRSQGLTQAQLAGLSNTGVRFISDLENGKETVELGKAMYLANLLGMDLIFQNRGDA